MTALAYLHGFASGPGSTKAQFFRTRFAESGTTLAVPDLAPDVFLYATVGGLENVTVPAGSYTGCQRVDYRIDYGESICTGEGSSEPLGTFRGQTLGYVLYAPDVGPVFSFEELSYADVTGDCGVTPDVVVERVILKLTEAPVSTEPVTWGGLKARY